MHRRPGEFVQGTEAWRSELCAQRVGKKNIEQAPFHVKNACLFRFVPMEKDQKHIQSFIARMTWDDEETHHGSPWDFWFHRLVASVAPHSAASGVALDLSARIGF